jgi:hypothetical protein
MKSVIHGPFSQNALNNTVDTDFGSQFARDLDDRPVLCSLATTSHLKLPDFLTDSGKNDEFDS